MKEKKNFGEIFQDLRSQVVEKIDVREVREEAKSNQYDEFMWALQKGVAQFDGSFFISLRTKNEKIFSGIPRYVRIPRETPPSPVENHVLYYYEPDKNNLELWWSLPNKSLWRWLLFSEEAEFSLDRRVREDRVSVEEYLSGALFKKVDDYISKITKSKLRPNFNPKDWEKEGHTVVVQA